MTELEEFMKMLTGVFDNSIQKDQLEREGVTDFPFAKHVNTICNVKIEHLPEDFDGIFMVEESYYTVKDNTHASNHLFLFTKETDGILLTSYDIPDGYDKNTFDYACIDSMEYSALKKSLKFTPALYVKNGETWEGGSESMFTPVMKFKLHEKFTSEMLEVSESMEINGKRTFGYDYPIIYRRIYTI